MVLFFSEGVDVSALDPSHMYIFPNDTSQLESESIKNVSLGCSAADRGRDRSYREVLIRLDEPCETTQYNASSIVNVSESELTTSSGANGGSSSMNSTGMTTTTITSTTASSSSPSSADPSSTSAENSTSAFYYVGGYASDWDMLVDLGVFPSGSEIQQQGWRAGHTFQINATSAMVTDLSSSRNALVAVQKLSESFPGEHRTHSPTVQ